MHILCIHNLTHLYVDTDPATLFTLFDATHKSFPTVLLQFTITSMVLQEDIVRLISEPSNHDIRCLAVTIISCQTDALRGAKIQSVNEPLC